MGLRFRRLFRLAPGLRINPSRSGVSASIGGLGATLNVEHDKTTATAGPPGAGLSYRTNSSLARRGGLIGAAIVALAVLALFIAGVIAAHSMPA